MASKTNKIVWFTELNNTTRPLICESIVSDMQDHDFDCSHVAGTNHAIMVNGYCLWLVGIDLHSNSYAFGLDNEIFNCTDMLFIPIYGGVSTCIDQINEFLHLARLTGAYDNCGETLTKEIENVWPPFLINLRTRFPEYSFDLSKVHNSVSIKVYWENMEHLCSVIVDFGHAKISTEVFADIPKRDHYWTTKHLSDMSFACVTASKVSTYAMNELNRISKFKYSLV